MRILWDVSEKHFSDRFVNVLSRLKTYGTFGTALSQAQPVVRHRDWGKGSPLQHGQKIGAAYRLKVTPRVKALKKYRETGKEPWSIMEQCVWSSLGQFVVVNHTRLLSISSYHLPPSKLI